MAQPAGQRERDWDEEEVKRASDGKFSRTEGRRLEPGGAVTNYRTGATGQILGRSTDGYVVVELADGSRTKWRAESIQRPGAPPSTGDTKGKKKGPKPPPTFSRGGGRKVAPSPEAAPRQGGRRGRRDGLSMAEKDRRRGEDLSFDARDEIADARAEGRPAQLYLGDKMGAKLAQFRAAGIPVRRRPDGTYEADLPEGTVELRPGRRPLKEKAPAGQRQEPRDKVSPAQWAEALRGRPDVGAQPTLDTAQPVETAVADLRRRGVPVEQENGRWYAIVDGRRVAVRGG